MKKVELLSPVGNKEMLYQAIHNGCDAVYLSGSNYGARKYADNFNNEELVNAIKYSHLYGVKVYVTVNTLIYESEINDVIDNCIKAYKNTIERDKTINIEAFVDNLYKEFRKIVL